MFCSVHSRLVIHPKSKSFFQPKEKCEGTERPFQVVIDGVCCYEMLRQGRAGGFVKAGR
jgi:hypothetical protein